MARNGPQAMSISQEGIPRKSVAHGLADPHLYGLVP